RDASLIERIDIDIARAQKIGQSYAMAQSREGLMEAGQRIEELPAKRAGLVATANEIRLNFTASNRHATCSDFTGSIEPDFKETIRTWRGQRFGQTLKI